MFAMPQLRLIFLSLFVSSVAFSMERPEKEPIGYSKKNATNDKRSYKSNKYSSDEEDSFYGKQPYKPKGIYGDRRDIDPYLVDQLIEQAPDRVKRLINGLQKHNTNYDNTKLKRMLLHGPPGTGKTLLAKAIALKTMGRYYFIRTSKLLTSWKNCHENLFAEIDSLTKYNGEKPMVVIFDEMDQATNQYKDRNSSDKAMPIAFCSLLDYCEDSLPHLFFIGTTNNEQRDFPDEINSRFGSNIIHIPNPNFLKRKQLICYYLNKKNHTLTEQNIDDFAQRLDGKTCRDIRGIIDEAILFLSESDGIITLEEINLAEEENPYEPSKNEILAGELNKPIERVIELKAIKSILESEREIIEYEQKKDSFYQVNNHHNINYAQSTRHHDANYEQSRASFRQTAEYHEESLAQSERHHDTTIRQGADHHGQSYAQSDHHYITNLNQSANQHNASQLQAANHHNINHAQSLASFNQTANNHNASQLQATNHHNASFAQAANHHNINHAQSLASFNQQAQHHNVNHAQSLASFNQTANHHNASQAQAVNHHNATLLQTNNHHEDTNYRQDVDTAIDGVTNATVGFMLGGPIGALAGVPNMAKVYLRNNG